MTSIQFPIPYALTAVYGRSARARRLLVADHLAVDLPDVDALEAPVVMSARMAWATGGLPGQGPDKFQRVNGDVDLSINPKVTIRFYNDAFYAPVRKFSRYDETPSLVAAPSDLENPVSSENMLSTPFRHLFHDLQREEQAAFEKQAAGKLPSFNEAGIRHVEETGNGRDVRIGAAQEMLSGFIVVEGELWDRLPGEPRLRFERKLRLTAHDPDKLEGVMLVSIVDDHEFSNSLDTGFFRISRAEDCIEHLSNHFPENAQLQLFDELEIAVDSAFTFMEEQAEMIETAEKVLGLLEQYAWYWAPSLIESVNALKWAIAQKHDPERLDTIMQQMLPHLGQYSLIAKAIEASSERWSLRPMENGPGFGR